MSPDIMQKVTLFKAFCDENRWKILEVLQSGEKCACVLLNKLEISQPTLSHHMKILCDSGVVTGRKEGKWTHYSINPSGVEAAHQLLNTLTAQPVSPADCSCCAQTRRGDGIMENKNQLYVLTGFLSGIVEPLGVGFTLLAAPLVIPALPYLLSFAAGAMLYVVVEELVPEMARDGGENAGVLCFSLGFSLMMALDVALG